MPRVATASTSPLLSAAALTRNTLQALRGFASPAIARQMHAQFAITAPRAWGMRMKDVQTTAKDIVKACRRHPDGPATRHAVAAALWKSGWYEARLAAAYIDVPDLVTPAQMNAWCKDFDNWAVCDTLCFVLFDRVPEAQALARARAWSKARPEFVKRAGLALIAALALHRRDIADDTLAALVPLIARASTDERNFVKKGASWALRSLGSRRPALRPQVVELARSLIDLGDAARWVGRDVLRELKA